MQWFTRSARGSLPVIARPGVIWYSFEQRLKNSQMGIIFEQSVYRFGQKFARGEDTHPPMIPEGRDQTKESMLDTVSFTMHGGEAELWILRGLFCSILLNETSFVFSCTSRWWLMLAKSHEFSLAALNLNNKLWFTRSDKSDYLPHTVSL